MKQSLLGAGIFALFANMASAGTITINADNYKQIFHGAGATCDGYAGHWLSMSQENRDQAARMAAQDINLVWIKNYINDRPEVNPKPYDVFTECVNDIRKYNPDIKIHITVNDLPNEFERTDRNGENLKGEIDDSINGVYTKVARYYFDVLNALHSRGVAVDEFDLLNEPGGGDAILVKGKLFTASVSQLKRMINNPEINTNGIKMPKIVGPSHWSVDGTEVWLKEWQNALPKALENTDIISTHGYRAGWKVQSYRNVAAIAPDKPFYNNEQTGKLQSGDGLYEIWGEDEPEYVSDVAMALRVSDAIQGGVNGFFVFNLNNASGNNASLIRTPRRGAPSKSRIYSGFKQVTSTQPKDAYRVGRQVSDMFDARVVALRPMNGNKVYLHVTNVNDFAQDVTIDLPQYAVNAAKLIVSDANLDESVVFDQGYNTPQRSITFNVSPYSVNSFELDIQPEGSNTPSPTPSAVPTPVSTPLPTPVNTPSPVGAVFEAESGSAYGGARIYQDAAASNGAGIAWISTLGAGFSLSNIPASSGFSIRYASQNSGKISIKVNGADVTDLRFTSTGNWAGNYNTTTVNTPIPANASIDVFFDEGDAALNVDSVSFNPSVLGDPTPRPATPSPTPRFTPTPLFTATPTATPIPTPSPATGPAPAEWSFIVHKPTGYKIRSCATEDGASANLGPNSASWNCVQWKKVDRGGGFFHILGHYTNRYLAPVSDKNGAPIAVQPNAWKGDWTQWSHQSTGEGFGHIVHKQSGKLIFGSGQMDSNIQLQPSSWTGDYTRWAFEGI